MRSVVGALVVIAALAGSSTAEDIYRWKDASGGLHFQNVPTPGAGSAPRQEAQAMEGASGSEGAPAPEAPQMNAAVGENGEALPPPVENAVSSPEDTTAYSTDVSTRRNRLERELKSTESRLRDIDGRLAMLARARTKNAQGSDATGGVAALAHDVLSPEEEALVEEREELAQRAAEVRSDAADLRQEVEARLGTVPAWWSDLR